MSEHIYIILSKDEKAAYKRLAAEEGLPLSRWLTRALNRAYATKDKPKEG